MTQLQANMWTRGAKMWFSREHVLESVMNALKFAIDALEKVWDVLKEYSIVMQSLTFTKNDVIFWEVPPRWVPKMYVGKCGDQNE